MGEKAGWKYKEKPELEDACPSMLDGISPQRVEAKRLAYSSLLQDTGEAMKIPIPAVATATTLCHRFYTVQSMRHYDSWVIATACLFLGCKVSETPKALKDVIIHMWTMRHRGKVAELERISDREWQDGVRAAVLRGERALLYTIRFDFKAALPYQHALNLIKDLKLAGDDPEHPDNPDLMQTAWDMINLSLRTTLSLQFKPETIAAAAVLLAMKLHRMPTKLVDGKHWLLHRMCAVKPSPVEVAVEQLLDVAAKLRRFAAKRAAPKELVSLLQQQHGGEPGSLARSLGAGGQAAEETDAEGGAGNDEQQQQQQQQQGQGP